MSLYIKGIIMKNIIALFIISMLVFGFSSCKKNPVEPDLEPGRRDYTWTADTINTYMDAVFRIGGTSLTSLWGVGPSGNGNTIRKYNGHTWPVEATSFPSDAFALSCISANNIWVAGTEGNIWHYDGVWKQSAKYNENILSTYIFEDFYSNSEKDIYLVGAEFNDVIRSRGIILRFNGSQWAKAFQPDDHSYYIRINKDEMYPNDYFIYSLKWSSNEPGQTDTTTFLKYNGKNVETIYSETIQNYSPSILSNIGGRVYFGMKDGLYRYDNNQLVPFLKLTPNYSDRYMSFGKNEKDIFITTRDGIMHFNGTNVEYILKYPKQLIYISSVVFEKDVFVLTTPNWYTAIIYHGTLKN
jgi:hypothetical protein